jgi:hypothetical protein
VCSVFKILGSRVYGCLLYKYDYGLDYQQLGGGGGEPENSAEDARSGPGPAASCQQRPPYRDGKVGAQKKIKNLERLSH